ncbi:MAG: phosphoribosylglycinamide formyltransferase [Gemmatimonadota bacterium]
MTRVAVLASGAGSNLQALLEHLDSRPGSTSAAVSLVVSDRAEAHALERARLRGIPAVHVPRGAPAEALEQELAAHDADLVVLAGYLRLVPAAVVRRWAGRILNVHPALLPAFGGHGMYGHRVHDAVIASGARLSGVTVHFVDEQFDRGAIIAQWPVPVPLDDTADALAARVLAVEHRVYPWCVEAVANGSVRLGDDGKVQGELPYGFSGFAVEGGHPFVPDV